MIFATNSLNLKFFSSLRPEVKIYQFKAGLRPVNSQFIESPETSEVPIWKTQYISCAVEFLSPNLSTSMIARAQTVCRAIGSSFIIDTSQHTTEIMNHINNELHWECSNMTDSEKSIEYNRFAEWHTMSLFTSFSQFDMPHWLSPQKLFADQLAVVLKVSIHRWKILHIWRKILV